MNRAVLNLFKFIRGRLMTCWFIIPSRTVSFRCKFVYVLWCLSVLWLNKLNGYHFQLSCRINGLTMVTKVSQQCINLFHFYEKFLILINCPPIVNIRFVDTAVTVLLIVFIQKQSIRFADLINSTYTMSSYITLIPS